MSNGGHAADDQPGCERCCRCGLRLADTTSGAYTVTQLAAIDHPVAGTEDNLQFTVGYVATDGDGDTATGSLSIDVDDDTPVANPVAKSLTETGGGDTNLMFIIDVSGSMNDPSGLTGLSRLDVTKASVVELLDLYDNPGNVKVQIVAFASNAFIASPVWMTVDQAKAYVSGLNADGGSDYDSAIFAAQIAFDFAGKIAGAQNVSYFLSDGTPTENFGISPGEEAAWTNFLNVNDINSFAFGIGSGATLSTLNPLAYDGTGAGADRNAEIITDLERPRRNARGVGAAPRQRQYPHRGNAPRRLRRRCGLCPIDHLWNPDIRI